MAVRRWRKISTCFAIAWYWSTDPDVTVCYLDPFQIHVRGCLWEDNSLFIKTAIRIRNYQLLLVPNITNPTFQQRIVINQFNSRYWKVLTIMPSLMMISKYLSFLAVFQTYLTLEIFFQYIYISMVFSFSQSPNAHYILLVQHSQNSLFWFKRYQKNQACRWDFLPGWMTPYAPLPGHHSPPGHNLITHKLNKSIIVSQYS